MKRVFTLLFSTGLVATAGAQVVSLPYANDFETEASTSTSATAVYTMMSAGWSNVYTDQHDWIPDEGGTSSTNTGPSVDYNPGTSTGQYMYFETSSPAFGGNTAILESPQFDLDGATAPYVEFAYHMYGQTMGTLFVEVSNDFGATWATEWSLSGDQGDQWTVQRVNLIPYEGDTVIIRFRGVSGPDYYSDMAIDDFVIDQLGANNVALSAFVNPNLPACNWSDSVIVSLCNFGADTLTNATIDWTINGVAQTPLAWTGNLGTYDCEDVLVGVPAAINAGDDIEVWAHDPNGTPESTATMDNDSLFITVNPGLSGTYTIGGIGADYADFASAIADMNTYGVCGPVVFSVADGIYNEQITLTEVMNMDAMNTVTFQSASGDSSACAIEYLSWQTDSNWTIQMMGGDYFTFHQMGIRATGSSYGRALHLLDGAEYNTFSNCFFYGDTNSTSTSFNMAVIYSTSGEGLDNYNTITNNRIMGGSYGLRLYGDGTTALEEGNVVTNNHFSHQSYYVSYMYYQNNVEFSHNYYMGSHDGIGTQYGFYNYYMDGAARFENNEFYDTLGTGTRYGLYIGSSDATSANPSLVANNRIVVGNRANTSSIYGLYLSGCSYFNIAHNNVLVENVGTTCRALYVSGGGGCKVFNNNIVNNAANGQAVYISSTWSVFEMDNNNLMSAGDIGYFTANQATLADWQAASGFDMNGVSTDPMWISLFDMHTCNDTLDAAGMPLAYVTMDMDGDMRNSSTPDIGADEFFIPVDGDILGADIEKCPQDVANIAAPNWSDATYSWSTGATTSAITASTPGSYILDVTATCGMGTDTVVVTDKPLPVAGFTKQASFLTVIFTSTSTDATSWSWDFGDGNTSTDENPIHVYAAEGSYTVTLTVTNDCGVDTYSIVVNPSTIGLEELFAGSAVSTFPNPNNGAFTIAFDGSAAGNVTVEVVDLTGQVIYSKGLGENAGFVQEKVQLNGVATGMYLVKLSSDKGNYVDRIIVK